MLALGVRTTGIAPKKLTHTILNPGHLKYLLTQLYRKSLGLGLLKAHLPK